ncbi:pyridoxamine 5'-phosphate oxidase family protein [Trebonia kvetii]|uniref:Pyridoxamine 5'-phosphate oxidase family protein n=1 Tax=Trebonia kvetii TaxID=2480626 RepID=A0A6P2C702_9ACTN|nr:pyridoxamine 5'-phosphate oxidase family protein [Trebonia kvetii]TVZ06136.1 pyridoxamine 5'-phosphate oxidase family protein [Trebonia kvetii]
MTAERVERPPNATPRPAIELTAGECWQLLASVPIGRVVFTHRAMPAIRPVNHLVEGRTIIIRTHLGAAIASRATAGTAGAAVGPEGSRAEDPGSVVCYEADQIDPARHTGWSVIVTGLARLVTDPGAIARYADALHPWMAGEMHQVVAIEPRFVSGIRLVGWCT